LCQYVEKISDLWTDIIIPSIIGAVIWSWLYGSWIYNYLHNQCLSPLKLWVRTLFMARCTRYNNMW
jgi:uncharacterized protein (DUF2062 family)